MTTMVEPAYLPFGQSVSALSLFHGDEALLADSLYVNPCHSSPCSATDWATRSYRFHGLHSTGFITYYQRDQTQ
jgi:hypothetical protein